VIFLLDKGIGRPSGFASHEGSFVSQKLVIVWKFYSYSCSNLGIAHQGIISHLPMLYGGTAATPDNVSRNPSAIAMPKQQKKHAPTPSLNHTRQEHLPNANPLGPSRTPTRTVDLESNRQRKEIIQQNRTHRTILISSFYKNHLIERLRSSSTTHHFNKSSPLLSPA
jgi:hypothetical protein